MPREHISRQQALALLIWDLHGQPLNRTQFEGEMRLRIAAAGSIARAVQLAERELSESIRRNDAMILSFHH
jgi:hypothetical protein